jgi:rhamnose transport system permease protein
VSDVVLITVTGLLLIFSVVAPSIGAAVREWRHTRRVRQSFSRSTPAGSGRAADGIGPHRQPTAPPTDRTREKEKQ